MMLHPKGGGQPGFYPRGRRKGDSRMKKSRGGRMTAAKKRAKKKKGGKGKVSKRKVGRKIMKT
jgi:hypothetical protein